MLERFGAQIVSQIELIGITVSEADQNKASQTKQ